jgi:hypothetical protein
VLKGKVVNQAGLNHQAHRRDRAPAVKQIVKDAVAAKKQLPGASGGKRVVRENRAAERAAMRGAGLNGALPSEPSLPTIHGEAPDTTVANDQNAAAPASAAPSPSVKSLWSLVNVFSK